MNLRGPLFGSTLRIVLLATLLLVALVGGAFAAGALGAPSVSGVENRLTGVNGTTTTIATDVLVTNPNPFGASLSGVSVGYGVRMNGIAMATGTKEGVSIGTGESAVSTETRMRNERIPRWWVSHLRNDERTTLVVDANVRSETVNRTFDASPVEREIETDLVSQFNSTETRPVNASRPLVSDPVLYVNETSARWGSITEDRSTVEMTFTVYNPKAYPLTVTKLNYTTTMNDVTVGTGETDRGYVVPPGSERTLRASITIDNGRLDEWWVSHLERNQRTDLRIDFAAVVDVGGTELAISLDELTYEETMETDIFGNKAEYPLGHAGTNDSGSNERAGTDGDESTGTETPTDDDGLLGGDGTPTPTTSTGERTTSSAEPTTTDGGAGEQTTDGATTTATRTPAAGPTTDDGGLLGDRAAPP